MPLPPLDAAGILPAGIHEGTLDEIEGLFARSDPTHRRSVLFQKLCEFVDWMKTLDPTFHHLCIDGSFVTNKEVPSDIDATLELPTPTGELLQKMLVAGLLNIDQIRKDFLVHLYPTFESAGNDFRSFFQYLRPEDAQDRGLKAGVTKGVIRLVL